MVKLGGDRIGDPSSNMNEAVFISFRRNSLKKGMNITILSPANGNERSERAVATNL